MLTFDQNLHAPDTHITSFPNEVTTSPWVEWGLFWGIVLPVAGLTFWIIYTVLLSEARRKVARNPQRLVELVKTNGERAFAVPIRDMVTSALGFSSALDARFRHTEELCQVVEQLHKELNDALNAKTTIIGPQGIGQGLSASNISGGTVINIAVNQSGQVVEGAQNAAAGPAPLIQGVAPTLKIAEKPKDQTDRVWQALSYLVSLWQNRSGMSALLKGIQDCLINAQPYVPPREDLLQKSEGDK